MPPTMFVDLPISTLSSISFFLHIFAALLFDAYKFRITIFLGELTLYNQVTSLFVLVIFFALKSTLLC